MKTLILHFYCENYEIRVPVWFTHEECRREAKKHGAIMWTEDTDAHS